jgi:hypothetical protein
MIEFNLNDDDVVHMEHGQSMLNASTFKVGQFKHHFRNYKNALGPAIESWVSEGINCEILRPGEGWQKGKVRLQVQFIPDELDEPSSPNQSDWVLSPNPQS